MTMDQLAGRIGPGETSKYRVLHMRAPIPEDAALVINVTGADGKPDKGDFLSWRWASPMNTMYRARISFPNVSDETSESIFAVSVECLWQGLKIWTRTTVPDPGVLGGDWRKTKGLRPVGHWAGTGQPLFSLFQARLNIYIPAYRFQVMQWLIDDMEVQRWVDRTRLESGPVYLRDFDIGQSLDDLRPMSHAWLLATFLNKGVWPDGKGGL